MANFLATDYRRLAEYRGRRSLRFLLECLLFDNGFQAVALHRLASWLKRMPMPGFAPAVARFNLWLTGTDISPRALIGPGLVISHGVGLVVGGNAIVGSNVLLHHQVTIGATTPGRIEAMPIVGDGVSLGAGAMVIGPVRVGDGAFVGAGVLVLEDVPPATRITLAQETSLAPIRKSEEAEKTTQSDLEKSDTADDDAVAERVS